MKIVCAWCNKDLGTKPGGNETTHSICNECFIEHMPAPQEDIWLTTYIKSQIKGREVHKVNQTLAGYYGAIDCYHTATAIEDKVRYMKMYTDCAEKLRDIVRTHKRKGIEK